jgi:hypothetical protein
MKMKLKQLNDMLKEFNLEDLIDSFATTKCQRRPIK